METKILRRMIDYFGNDIRRVSHSLKVYGYAKALSGTLDEKRRETLLLAAILHDIGIKNAELRHGSSAGEYQELEGPPVAKEILEEEGAAPETVDRVCYLVGHHHSYAAIDGADFQILVEADFLVNLNEEHLPSGAVRAARDKYFRTPEAVSMLNRLFQV